MVKLYSVNGETPRPLPKQVRDPNGVVRSDLHHFIDEQLAVWGVVRAPDKPEPPDGNHTVTWTDGSWIINQPTQEVLADLVGIERDRRLGLDFEFGGKMFQRDARSLSRINGAGTLAGLAVTAGAEEGDLGWVQLINPNADDAPFGWIASDDTVMPMDAHTLLAFGATAAAVETGVIFAAKALREMDEIPLDYADDKYWP